MYHKKMSDYISISSISDHVMTSPLLPVLFLCVVWISTITGNKYWFKIDGWEIDQEPNRYFHGHCQNQEYQYYIWNDVMSSTKGKSNNSDKNEKEKSNQNNKNQNVDNDWKDNNESNGNVDNDWKDNNESNQNDWPNNDNQSGNNNENNNNNNNDQNQNQENNLLSNNENNNDLPNDNKDNKNVLLKNEKNETLSTEKIHNINDLKTNHENNVLPTKNNVLLTKNNVLPTKNNVLLTKNNVLPTKNNVLLTKNNVLPTKNNVLLTKNNVLPTKNNVLLTKNNVLPTKNKKHNLKSNEKSYVLPTEKLNNKNNMKINGNKHKVTKNNNNGQEYVEEKSNNKNDMSKDKLYSKTTRKTKHENANNKKYNGKKSNKEGRKSNDEINKVDFIHDDQNKSQTTANDLNKKSNIKNNSNRYGSRNNQNNTNDKDGNENSKDWQIDDLHNETDTKTKNEKKNRKDGINIKQSNQNNEGGKVDGETNKNDNLDNDQTKKNGLKHNQQKNAEWKSKENKNADWRDKQSRKADWRDKQTKNDNGKNNKENKKPKNEEMQMVWETNDEISERNNTENKKPKNEEMQMVWETNGEISEQKEKQTSKIKELLRKPEPNDEIVASLLYLAVFGLPIDKIYSNEGAIGLSSTLYEVMKYFFSSQTTLNNKVEMRVEDGVQGLAAKAVHMINKRVDDDAEYDLNEMFHVENDMIGREYAHMLSMYLECGMLYQRYHKELDNSMNNESINWAIDEHIKCLTFSYRYIHSGFDKFALFFDSIEHNPVNLRTSSLTVNQARRIDRNMRNFRMYNALIRDITIELIGMHSEKVNVLKMEEYRQSLTAILNKARLYKTKINAELWYHHTYFNYQHCRETIRCEEANRESENTAHQMYNTQLNCSCILDPLTLGESARCYTRLTVTTDNVWMKKSMNKKEIMVHAYGDEPAPALEAYFSVEEQYGIEKPTPRLAFMKIANAWEQSQQKPTDRQSTGKFGDDYWAQWYECPNMWCVN